MRLISIERRIFITLLALRLPSLNQALVSLGRFHSSISTIGFVPNCTPALNSFRPRQSKRIEFKTYLKMSMSAVSMDSPSAERNKDPIWSVLSSKVVPSLDTPSESQGAVRVLEIAAGCGVHMMHFTTQMVKHKIPVRWYPTDPHPLSRQAIQERIDLAPSPEIQYSIQAPMSLSLNENGLDNEDGKYFDTWKGGEDMGFKLILCINMIHISPWEATIGLFRLAKENVVSGGILYCYGPYKVGGTAVESNLAFDRSLKSRNSAWGIRDLEMVTTLAEENGFQLQEKIEMPANNLSVIFKKI